MGGSRFFVALLAVFTICGVAAAGEAGIKEDPLGRVRALVNGGAGQLALRLIDQYQPLATAPADWMAWERQRFALYRAQASWDQLVRRADELPDTVPAEFRRWANTEAAAAALNAGNAVAARRILRGLIRDNAGDMAGQAEWRQLVIRSYLIEDNLADALVALERYRVDFGTSGRGWRQLEATILLRAGRTREAYVVAAELKTHEAELIALLAALRGSILPPAVVAERAGRVAEETRNRPELSGQCWALAAEAADRAHSPVGRIHALERALTLARAPASRERLISARADDLWDAYQQFAEAIGNDQRLLIGKDEPWLKRAESWSRDEAAQARAFHAFLAMRGATTETRELATRRLTESLLEDGRGKVLRELYTASARFPELTDVPEYVRYHLTEQALADYDIAFAARLMQGLEAVPQGSDPGMWALRRARVFVYAGDYAQAGKTLTAQLAGSAPLSDAFAERFLQVVFDLQAAGRHDQAIDLLEALMTRVTSSRLQREILYWIADSKAAQGQAQQAAEFYLRSATYQHPTGGDMWGQTARFHAAENLARAGLTQDARLVYQALLKHTADARQRAVIERGIQQLWLIENRPATR